MREPQITLQLWGTTAGCHAEILQHEGLQPKQVQSTSTCCKLAAKAELANSSGRHHSQSGPVQGSLLAQEKVLVQVQMHWLLLRLLGVCRRALYVPASAAHAGMETQRPPLPAV